MLEDEGQYPTGLAIPLLRKQFERGKLLCKLPSIAEIQSYHIRQLDLLPSQFRDLDFKPKEFPVFISEKLKRITKQFRPA